MHFEKAGAHGIANPVIDIPDRAAENQRQSEGRQREFSADPENEGEDYHSGENGKSREQPAHAFRGRRILEKAEGRSGVHDVRDAKDARDDGDGIAFRNVMAHPDLGEAIESDDAGRDEKQPLAPVTIHSAEAPTGTGGGSMPISRSADWQRWQTLGH